jgi:hypothetical protein
MKFSSSSLLLTNKLLPSRATQNHICKKPRVSIFRYRLLQKCCHVTAAVVVVVVVIIIFSSTLLFKAHGYIVTSPASNPLLGKPEDSSLVIERALESRTHHRILLEHRQNGL